MPKVAIFNIQPYPLYPVQLFHILWLSGRKDRGIAFRPGCPGFDSWQCQISAETC